MYDPLRPRPASGAVVSPGTSWTVAHADDGDAGMSAAGTTVDAGPVDAGPVDAGSVDAGSVDARPVDEGSVDAGSVDAGSVDAGSVIADVVVVVEMADVAASLATPAALDDEVVAMAADSDEL